MCDILKQISCMGCELDCPCAVNTGLGFSAPKYARLLKEIIEEYERNHFVDKHDNPIYFTAVNELTKYLGI